MRGGAKTSMLTTVSSADRPAGVHRVLRNPADRAGRHVEHLAVDLELHLSLHHQHDLVERMRMRLRPLLARFDEIEGEQRVVAAEAGLLHVAVEAVVTRQLGPFVDQVARILHHLAGELRLGGVHLMVGLGRVLSFLRRLRVFLLVRGEEEIVGARRRKDIDVEHRLVADRPAGVLRVGRNADDRARSQFHPFAFDLEQLPSRHGQHDLVERMMMRLPALHRRLDPVEREQDVVTAEAGADHRAAEQFDRGQVRPLEDLGRRSFSHRELSFSRTFSPCARAEPKLAVRRAEPAGARRLHVNQVGRAASASCRCRSMARR